MKISIIDYLICPFCSGNFLFSIHKKTKGRVLDGELICKRCGKKFYIKDGIAYFIADFNKQTLKNKRLKLRKITIEQEIPKTWMKFFSRKELTALMKEWDWMISTVKKEKDAVHLDFATGTGRFLRHLISKTKGQIIVLDYDYSTCPELLYLLKKIKRYKRVSIVCADARRMPFKQGMFNSITSWHGFGEQRMERVINESKRVLKKGAYLAASGIHYQKGSKSFSTAKKEHIRFLTKEAIMLALRKVGFQGVEHKVFFKGRWNERGSYLPLFDDFYSTYAIKASK